MSHYTRANPSTRPRSGPKLIPPGPTPRRPFRDGKKKRGNILKRIFLHIIGWPLVLLLFLVLLAEAGMLMLLFGERDYTNRIYPNITVRGLDLSNHTLETAHLALQKRYEPFLNNPVELRYGDLSWYPSAEELGVELDFERAVREAAAIGRTDTRIDNTRQVARVWEEGAEVPLHVTVDQTMMQGYLLQVAHVLDTPSSNADLDLQGTNLFVTDGQAGFQVLVDETVREITSAVQGLEPQEPVSLQTRKIAPQVDNADLAPIIGEIHELLDEPIVLNDVGSDCTGQCSWSWSPTKISSWINLIRSTSPDGRPTISIDIDQAKIRKALAPITEAVRREGTLPRVAWNEGNLLITQPGTGGRGLDVALAQARINEALTRGARQVDLPMIDIAPPVHEGNLASLGIVQPVATGVSSFLYSEQYRITNIRAGARRMNGVLVPPDRGFSFNETLGPVDGLHGFVQGYAIVNNRTQQEWGGGLCQVSTTMFRAAFWAGLPITERHEHDFRISWYEELGEPPGFDAAIFTPSADLQFVNDTGGWLLIQTWVDLNRQRLFITLYGPPIQRKVNISHRVLRHIPAPTKPVTVEDPTLPVGTFKQTDWAQPGMDVNVYREVWEYGNLLRRDTFETHFQPWPDIYVRGTRR